MSISVVIPVFNESRTIAACLHAVLAQEAGVPFEVIVVDNGSSDDTVARCRAIADVQVYECATPGSYAARNLGVSRASGELLVFLDSDCVPQPGWLAALVECSHRHPLLMGSMALADAPQSLHWLQDYQNLRTEQVLRSNRSEQYYGYTANMAVAREVFDQVGPFWEIDRGADTVFVQKVANVLGPESIGYCPQAQVTHLEIESYRQWLRKQMLYGASNARQGEARGPGWCRPLSVRQRLALCWQLWKRQPLSGPELVRLLSLLGAAGLAYQWGRTAGWFQRHLNYREEVDIDSPIEQVWEVLRQVEKWPQWTPSMEQVQWLAGPAEQTGSTVRIKQPKLPANTWTITDWQPGAEFSWETRSPGFLGRARHSLQARAEGSRLTLELTFSGPIGWLAGLMGGRLTRRYVAWEADGLKAAAERSR